VIPRRVGGVHRGLLRGKWRTLRDPRKPKEPELFQEITLPDGSVMVTMVLLKDALITTSPWGMCLRSFS